MSQCLLPCRSQYAFRSKMYSVPEVNSMPDDRFVWVFGNVIELCKDAAVWVKKKRPFNRLADLCTEFHKYLDNLSVEEKLGILKSHPDLAGRLAALGELTKESIEEQKSAGLDKINAEQKSIINACNERYKLKFGFPFIICARENKVQSIIDGLNSRILNSRDQEIETGINEVKKICKLRILDIVNEN
ncbi:2-oxo-4-hydroxy-4-carboxy-5-ureidoimidazoline decarboxylase-like [Pieris rapae]|uniref:2-oxo-4-hydroxy-4-carboxy-5-ureidoimidazoline decarboxylase-like n=1 Tax=Pieris rapae TaxID=64459 RepID=UPI001E27A92B|nr:2-oxo-4-hydroxy-4-carboxy-5-ureidoimidazoline decarboxylase-like [Pieris rapae]